MLNHSLVGVQGLPHHSLSLPSYRGLGGGQQDLRHGGSQQPAHHHAWPGYQLQVRVHLPIVKIGRCGSV